VFFAGIDWADDHHDIAVLDQEGQLVGSLRVSHSPAGLAQLKAFLLDITGDPSRSPALWKPTTVCSSLRSWRLVSQSMP
jgi:hypothetical protein